MAEGKIGDITFRDVGIAARAAINNVIATVIFKAIIATATTEIVVTFTPCNKSFVSVPTIKVDPTSVVDLFKSNTQSCRAVFLRKIGYDDI